jgi:methylthioribose-1-phosphate isomerase
MPTQGIQGTNIFGNTLKALPGKNINLPKGKGVTYSGDRTAMYAGTSGMVDIINDIVVVSNVYNVNGDADMSVGNIELDGDVCIRGGVIGGINVRATGNIVVLGVVGAARIEAQAIADEDAESCKRIGLHGLEIIKGISLKKNGGTVNILTHCNAGWLAFVDYGSALSPVYAAFDQGIDVHVWVDETRPRNQGASLTAWELSMHGVKHSLIADNAGGHLMQHGMVDIVITGADRVTRNADAANKIGTYLKALAAKENGVPFYVALPSSTFDFKMRDGVKEIPIEERGSSEVKFITGITNEGKTETVRICPEETNARNWGFDVTPAKFITGLISERGICAANEEGILSLYPEFA